MLANLLPGVRDLRAPLAAGYVWLLALFLAFEPLLPSRQEATGIWASLIRIQGSLGAIGLGIALSFAAYLVGSVSDAVTSGVVRAAVRMRRTPNTPDTSYSERGKTALQDVVSGRMELLRQALREHGTTLAALYAQKRRHAPEVDEGSIPRIRDLLDHVVGPSFEDPVADPVEADRRATLTMGAGLQHNVKFEFDLMLTRLLGRDSELFSAIDRLRAEAEFRIAVTAPLLALAAALAWRATWWSAVLVAMGALLLARQGAQRNRAANDALLEALRVDRAQAPTIDRIDALVKEITELPREHAGPTRQAPDEAPRSPRDPGTAAERDKRPTS
jgi:hypothetical protein